jgi:hypothetical protein
MVAKYFDKIRKNPIEEFHLFCGKHNLTPQTRSYKYGQKGKMVDDDSDSDRDNGYPEDEMPHGKPYVLHKCAIIYQGNKVLCKSYGNTKEQAKKNAHIIGYAKLWQELQETGDLIHTTNEDVTMNNEVNQEQVEDEDMDMDDSSDDIYKSSEDE